MSCYTLFKDFVTHTVNTVNTVNIFAEFSQICQHFCRKYYQDYTAFMPFMSLKNKHETQCSAVIVRLAKIAKVSPDKAEVGSSTLPAPI